MCGTTEQHYLFEGLFLFAVRCGTVRLQRAQFRTVRSWKREIRTAPYDSQNINSLYYYVLNLLQGPADWKRLAREDVSSFSAPPLMWDDGMYIYMSCVVQYVRCGASRRTLGCCSIFFSLHLFPVLFFSGMFCLSVASYGNLIRDYVARHRRLLQRMYVSGGHHTTTTSTDYDSNTTTDTHRIEGVQQNSALTI